MEKKKKVRQMQYSKTTRPDDSSGSRLVHHKQGKLKKKQIKKITLKNMVILLQKKIYRLESS